MQMALENLNIVPRYATINEGYDHLVGYRDTINETFTEQR